MISSTFPGCKSVVPDKRLIISWGAGDQSRVNTPILESLGISTFAFIDQTPNLESPIRGVPLYRSLQELLLENPSLNLSEIGSVVAIGNPHGMSRIEFSEKMRSFGIQAVSFADQSAWIRSDAQISDGLQVMPGVVINNNVSIANQCILNTNALIEHDCILYDAVEIGPGAILNGRVNVGRNAWIGAGAIVLPRLRVGNNSIVGAGSVVTRDVPDNVIVVGAPARVLRETTR